MSSTISATKFAQCGVIGLGGLGQNLTLNIEDPLDWSALIAEVSDDAGH